MASLRLPVEWTLAYDTGEYTIIQGVGGYGDRGGVLEGRSWGIEGQIWGAVVAAAAE